MTNIEQRIADQPNVPEHQDKTFQRELMERAQRLARESAEHLEKSGDYKGIYGLLSLDDDIERSFSADPLKDPFGIDRARFPIGTAFFSPRMFIYYVAPAQPSGKWRCVITMIEDRALEEFRNDPGKTINKLSEKLKIEEAPFRKPDWLRIEFEIPTKFADFLTQHNFRAFPVDLLKILTGKGANAARTAFAATPIVPAAFFRNLATIVVSSVDWNAPLSPIRFAIHMLHHRNIVAAAMGKVFSMFDITLERGGQLLFMMRDILVHNDQMVSIVKTSDGASSVKATDKLMLRGVKDPLERQLLQDELEKVRETRTHYRQPVTYVTFRFRGVLKDTEIQFPKGVESVLPPEARTAAKVQTAPGVQEIIQIEEFSYRQKSATILGEIELIRESIERLFPERLTRMLTRLKH